jgi:hypothetical protein
MIGGIFLTEWVLPFLLLFVIVFALLAKSKLLGDGVQQINALVSLAVAILGVGVPYSRQIITDLMPLFGVALVSLFVFFVLYSFIVGDKMFEEGETKWLKYVLIGLVLIFAVGAILSVTGFWGTLSSNGFFDKDMKDMITNILFVVVIGVLIFWVYKASSGSKD